MINLILTWIFVFIVMTLADFCWAKYTQAIARGKQVAAPMWSAAIVLCGALVVTEYTENHWLISAAVAGAYCGTWLAMRNKKDG